MTRNVKVQNQHRKQAKNSGSKEATTQPKHERNQNRLKKERSDDTMREIKFRAWDTVSESMHYDIGVTMAETSDVFTSVATNISVHNKKVKIMQFTGLKDKNGKEIYEGDLLKEAEYPLYPAWEVFYEKDGFFIRTGDVTYRLAGVIGFPERLTIVGNIHENPELLKEVMIR